MTQGNVHGSRHGDKTRYTLVYRHSYVSCNDLIELMFLLLDVYVSSSFGRSGTT